MPELLLAVKAAVGVPMCGRESVCVSDGEEVRDKDAVED